MSIQSRINNTYYTLINKLQSQVEGRRDVEILSLYDNMIMEVGDKRNALLNMARGKYLSFVDDDDMVSDDYVKSVVFVIDKEKPDCIVFDSLCTNFKPGIDVLCKYGIEFEYWMSDDQKSWRGKPAHTMVWKSEIAKKHQYRGHRGEDMDWVLRAYHDIQRQARIKKTLYYHQKGKASTVNRKGSYFKNNIEQVIQGNKRKGVIY